MEKRVHYDAARCDARWMGTITRSAFAALAFACALAGTSMADRVRPTSDVNKYVIVRLGPNIAMPPTGRLFKGATAALLAENDHWYRVQLADGTEGWVPKSRTDAFAAASLKLGKPTRVSSVQELVEYQARPEPGGYRIHVIDVGTGLSMLIQGHNFDVLYDGGSNDDSEGRVMAYLFAALGPSGGSDCVPTGDQWQAPTSNVKIDHVFLSHPHKDHVSALDKVLKCYEVDHVWDPGALAKTGVYRDFVEAVAGEHGATYHTAASVPAGKTVKVHGKTIKMPSDVDWVTFAEGDSMELDETASFTILHANGETKAKKENENSTVVLMALGDRTLLLTGDAESSKKRTDAKLDGVEKHLVEKYGSKLHVDILQVGHHGSLTSCRKDFLDVVMPALAIVSSGPMKYSGTKLPDKAVLKRLKDLGAELVETYTHDGKNCPQADKVGEDDKPAKKRPGGCDNYVIDVAPAL